jgi:hypothetical protein
MNGCEWLPPIRALPSGRLVCDCAQSLSSLSAKLVSMDIEQADIMASLTPELDAALTELRNQGLTVRLHSIQNNTWHIADGGLYSGYVASGDELVELRRANKLNIRGIKNLG